MCMKNRLFGLPISLIVALMVVLGALFSREFFHIGKWIVIVALATYVVWNLKFFVWVAKTIKVREMKEIVLGSIVLFFAITMLSIILSNTIPFFMIVLLLACDYLIKDKK